LLESIDKIKQSGVRKVYVWHGVVFTNGTLGKREGRYESGTRVLFGDR